MSNHCQAASALFHKSDLWLPHGGLAHAREPGLSRGLSDAHSCHPALAVWLGTKAGWWG